MPTIANIRSKQIIYSIKEAVIEFSACLGWLYAPK
jgi:hypothetical protein